MSRKRFKQCGYAFGVLALAWIGFAVAGCGDGFKTVPVSGKITLNGMPIGDADATVMFRPDPDKGNTNTLDFSGVADENGVYELCYANGKPGAAPGWYKVAVVVTEFPGAKAAKAAAAKGKIRQPGPGAHGRKALMDPKYTIPSQSGIEIEVVENPSPGAYDLNVTGPARQ
jgi:hypothetical protein